MCSEGIILHGVCSGTSFSPVTSDPCGRTAQLSDSESNACRYSPPDKSPWTLRLRCKGTDAYILHDGCGGTPPVLVTSNPCGRTARESYSRSCSPQTPQISHLTCLDPVDSPTHVGCGGLLPPLCSIPKPSTASFSDNGHESAMLLSSVKEVNSTPLQVV